MKTLNKTLLILALAITPLFQAHAEEEAHGPLNNHRYESSETNYWMFGQNQTSGSAPLHVYHFQIRKDWKIGSQKQTVSCSGDNMIILGIEVNSNYTDPNGYWEATAGDGVGSSRSDLTFTSDYDRGMSYDVTFYTTAIDYRQPSQVKCF